MVNIQVRELSRSYDNENVYYRCHIKCDCSNRTKTFYFEKVMNKNDDLFFTEDELIELFKQHPWDVRELSFNIEIQEEQQEQEQEEQQEEQQEQEQEEQQEEQQEEENNDEDDRISGFTDIELNDEERELLLRLKEKKSLLNEDL
jgi:FtsZ-interacting cell division protein YlmF